MAALPQLDAERGVEGESFSLLSFFPAIPILSIEDPTWTRSYEQARLRLRGFGLQAFF